MSLPHSASENAARTAHVQQAHPKETGAAGADDRAEGATLHARLGGKRVWEDDHRLAGAGLHQLSQPGYVLQQQVQ